MQYAGRALDPTTTGKINDRKCSKSNINRGCAEMRNQFGQADHVMVMHEVDMVLKGRQAGPGLVDMFSFPRPSLRS